MRERKKSNDNIDKTSSQHENQCYSHFYLLLLLLLFHIFSLCNDNNETDADNGRMWVYFLFDVSGEFLIELAFMGFNNDFAVPRQSGDDINTMQISDAEPW